MSVPSIYVSHVSLGAPLTLSGLLPSPGSPWTETPVTTFGLEEGQNVVSILRRLGYVVTENTMFELPKSFLEPIKVMNQKHKCTSTGLSLIVDDVIPRRRDTIWEDCAYLKKFVRGSDPLGCPTGNLTYLGVRPSNIRSTHNTTFDVIAIRLGTSKPSPYTLGLPFVRDLLIFVHYYPCDENNKSVGKL